MRANSVNQHVICVLQSCVKEQRAMFCPGFDGLERTVEESRASYLIMTTALEFHGSFKHELSLHVCEILQLDDRPRRLHCALYRCARWRVLLFKACYNHDGPGLRARSRVLLRNVRCKHSGPGGYDRLGSLGRTVTMAQQDSQRRRTAATTVIKRE